MDQINLLMARASKQRAVGVTDMNAASSRSHSVFALYLKGVNEALGSELHGALHLVDLAGSERLDRSGATVSIFLYVYIYICIYTYIYVYVWVSPSLALALSFHLSIYMFT